MGQSFLATLSSGTAIAALAVFILAIKTSYAIEKATKPAPRFPRYTNIVSSALGIGVDPDDTATKALVSRLRWLLLIAFGFLGGLAFVAMSISGSIAG